MKKLPILLVILLLSSCAGISQSKKVVLVIVDGIPADLIKKYDTPTLDEIAATGGFSLATTGGSVGTPTESPTISAVGYNHVLTGTWSNTHQVWTNEIRQPNYDAWNLFRIAESQPYEQSTAIYSTWLDNRTKLVGDGLPSAGGIHIDYAYDGFEKDTVAFPHDAERAFILKIDQMVSNEAARHIANEGPDVAWIYLEYTDDMGHRHGDSPEMERAVALTDDMLSGIWAAVQERNKGGDDYLLLITTDHGRDASSGKGHGGQSERERTVWIVANKPLPDHPITHVDILPSIVNYMGYEVPDAVRAQWEGSSFFEY